MTSLEHAALTPLVYRKLQAVFGGRMRFAVSGGGPLGERLTHFFNGVGVKIFEGYGLTETSPTLTVNRADAWKPGTVGTPLAATSIRIADDGEILAKGPQVFQGYWRNEGATEEMFDTDGWLLTGDVGLIDEDGFLRITGRKKELIVTAAGKNVAPAPLEDRLRAHPLISQAVVVGDARPFIAALITLDPEAIVHWAGAHDLTRHPHDRAHGKHRPTGGHPVRNRRRQPVGIASRIHSRVRSPARGPHHRGGRAHSNAEGASRHREQALRPHHRAHVRVTRSRLVH